MELFRHLWSFLSCLLCGLTVLCETKPLRNETIAKPLRNETIAKRNHCETRFQTQFYINDIQGSEFSSCEFSRTGVRGLSFWSRSFRELEIWDPLKNDWDFQRSFTWRIIIVSCLIIHEPLSFFYLNSCDTVHFTSGLSQFEFWSFEVWSWVFQNFSLYAQAIQTMATWTPCCLDLAVRTSFPPKVKHMTKRHTCYHGKIELLPFAMYSLLVFQFL